MKAASLFLSTRMLMPLFVLPLLPPTAAKAAPPQKPAAGRIAAVAFSPDGKTLAAASTSGVIQLWDTTNGAAVGNWADLQTLICLAFSPDGKTLAGKAAQPYGTFKTPRFGLCSGDTPMPLKASCFLRTGECSQPQAGMAP